MSTDAPFGDDTSREPLTDVPAECYDVLRNPRRLRLLEHLGRCDRRLTVDELTSELVAHDPQDGSSTPREIRVSLVHNHLPRLAEYDIVDWDVDAGVELVDSFPIEPIRLAEALDSDGREGALQTVVHPVRLPLCAVLAARTQPCSLAALADELAATDVVDNADRAAIELHHTHLPALADAGLIDYDSDTQLVHEADHSLPAIV